MTVIKKATFSNLDYLLFGFSLAVSVAIGCYHGYLKRFFGSKHRKTQHSLEDELFAGGKLSALPVAMSLIMTFLSSISFLGFPTEIYRFGTMFCYYGLMYFIVFPLVAIVFLPVVYKLKLSSAYGYLELRFNSKVRLAACIIFCFETFLYLSVGLYAPALILNSVTDISLIGSILITGSVCVLYTSLGGAKTVIYTNVYQFILIVGGLLTLVVVGLKHVGGLDNVWKRALEGGRIDFYEFNADPRIRHSFWSLMIGGTFTLLALYCTNQMTFQRYLSMRSLKEAQKAVILNAPLNLMIITLYTLTGLIIFAAFYNCDPKKAGFVKKAEEVLAYFVVHDLSHLKGVPGIFVSAIYGAGLSTVAGGLNSLSAVIFVDFVKPFYAQFRDADAQPLSEKTSAFICKMLTVINGICIILLAFMYVFIDAPILQIALSLFGICGGPILGVFCLGMFFRRPNAAGAFLGLLTSFALTTWIGLEPFFSTALNATPLPVSIDGCNVSHFFTLNHNFSESPMTTTPLKISLPDVSTKAFENTSDLLAPFSYNNSDLKHGISSREILRQITRMSYQYYSLFAVLMVIFFGYMFSIIFDFCTNNVNRKILHERSHLLFVDWSTIFRQRTI